MSGTVMCLGIKWWTKSECFILNRVCILADVVTWISQSKAKYIEKGETFVGAR